MKVKVEYERQFYRDGVWWRCGWGTTLDQCRERASNYAGLQPKGDGFDALPKRTLKITTERRTEVAEDS